MQTVPLHPPVTHSQPKTTYTDITATAGVGIITYFWAFKICVESCHHSSVSGDNSLLCRASYNNDHSNYVTPNLTNGFSASADSSFLCRDDASRSHYHVSHSHCYSTCRGYSKFNQLPAYFRYLVKCNRYTRYSTLTLAFLIPNICILLSLQTLYPFQKLSGCNCTI